MPEVRRRRRKEKEGQDGRNMCGRQNWKTDDVEHIILANL